MTLILYSNECMIKKIYSKKRASSHQTFLKTQLEKRKQKLKLTIYAPMNYTAPCVRFLMRADTLCGEVGGGGGWRWKSRVLWAPVKLHEPIGECNLGPKIIGA